MSEETPIFRLPPYTITQVLTPLSETRDWSHEFLRIPALWKQTKGKGVVVAVLDTGVDSRHPDLQGALLDLKDFTGSTFGPEDRQGHGTHCISSIASRENDLGVAGIAPECQILSAKVLGDDGSGSDESVIRGIEWAARQGADIISMSLGGPNMGNRMLSALRAFVAVPGKFIFAAAGNDGRPNSVNYPAKWVECLCIGSVDKNGKVSRFSSRGPRVDVVAPGENILAAIPGGYARMSGTSMATPIAAAIGALCLAKHKEHGGQTSLQTYLEMREHLRKTAIDKGAIGHDSEYGWGLINPEDLMGAGAPAVVPPVNSLPATLTFGGRQWAGMFKDIGPASIDTTEHGDG